MNKKLLLTLVLAFTATSVFASKARLISLGQDKNGSWLIDDERSIFLNPAHLNHHKDFVTMEWGNNANSTVAATGDSVETDTAPQAEGGFVSASGRRVMGVYLGRESDVVAEVRNSAVDLPDMDNAIDFFIGGDNGTKWGFNLLYSASEDETTAGAEEEQTLLSSNIGIIKGDAEYYLKLSLVNEAEKGTAEFDGGLGAELGGIWRKGSMTYYFKAQTQEFETLNSGASVADVSVMKVYAYAGKTRQISKKVSLMGSIGIAKEDKEVTSAGVTVEEAEMTIPLVVAVEGRVKEWLSLRGSVSQNIWGEEEDTAGKKSTPTNSTNVNAGMGLHFGDLTIDGVIGTSVNGTAVDTGSEQGVLAGDNFMTRVGMTYNW